MKKYRGMGSLEAQAKGSDTRYLGDQSKLKVRAWPGCTRCRWVPPGDCTIYLLAIFGRKLKASVKPLCVCHVPPELGAAFVTYSDALN